MYKLTTPFKPDMQTTSVIRIADNACIPFDPDNTDYQAFLKYQAEGGKVYGADETLPAEEQGA